MREMDYMKHGRPSEPDSWAGSEQDPNWIALRRKRDIARGRIPAPGVR